MPATEATEATDQVVKAPPGVLQNPQDRTAARDWLDEHILMWEELRKSHAHQSTAAVAEGYVDALQTARRDLLGEQLRLPA